MQMLYDSDSFVVVHLQANELAEGEAHPPLGRHLRASVRTGRHCVYEPEDDVTWHT